MTTSTWTTEVTNVCTCNHDNDCGWVDCLGDCWEDCKFFVEQELGDLWERNCDWVVEGLPLWDRNVSGVFRARTIDEFIEGITVKGEWVLRLKRESNVVHARLSHHDVPTGRSFTVRRVELSDDCESE